MTENYTTYYYCLLLQTPCFIFVALSAFIAIGIHQIQYFIVTYNNCLGTVCTVHTTYNHASAMFVHYVYC